MKKTTFFYLIFTAICLFATTQQSFSQLTGTAAAPIVSTIAAPIYYYIESAAVTVVGAPGISVTDILPLKGKGYIIYSPAVAGALAWRISTGTDDEKWAIVSISGALYLKNKGTGLYLSGGVNAVVTASDALVYSSLGANQYTFKNSSSALSATLIYTSPTLNKWSAPADIAQDKTTAFFFVPTPEITDPKTGLQSAINVANETLTAYSTQIGTDAGFFPQASYDALTTATATATTVLAATYEQTAYDAATTTIQNANATFLASSAILDNTWYMIESGKRNGGKGFSASTTILTDDFTGLYITTATADGLAMQVNPVSTDVATQQFAIITVSGARYLVNRATGKYVIASGKQSISGYTPLVAADVFQSAPIAGTTQFRFRNTTTAINGTMSGSYTIAHKLSLTAPVLLNRSDVTPLANSVNAFNFRNPVVPSNTITFNALSTKAVTNADFTLSATTTSGLVITYTSSNTAVATVTGNTVHIVGAGSTDITANQAGNQLDPVATPVIQALTINKIPQAITFPAIETKTRNSASFNLAATTDATGLVVTYASSDDLVATVTSTGTVTITATADGFADITASQAGDAVYVAATSVINRLNVSGITGLTSESSNITVVAKGNMIEVKGTDALVKAFTTSGVEVNVANALAKGIYIVKVAGLTTKVVIK